MATPTSTRTQRLTRPSGLGARGWALPVVFLLPALVMSVLAARQLDALYRDDAGVLRAEQLVPWTVGVRHGDFGHDDPVSSAARAAAKARWERLARGSADQARALVWRESSGRMVVVVATITGDAGRTSRSLRARSATVRGSGRERIGVWTEGDRVVLAVAVTPAGPRDSGVDTALAERVTSVRSALRLQRAASLTAGAVAPVIALVLALLAATIALVIVALPILLVVKVVPGLDRRLRRWRDTHAGGGSDVPAVELTPGVEVIQLPPWRISSRTGFLRVVPLAIVALPAATTALWPGALVWAAVIGLVFVLTMRWAEGLLAARWLRRILYAVLCLGLARALFSWPQVPTTDRRLLGPLALTAGSVAVLWLVRRRRTDDRVGGILGARWVVFVVGFVWVAAASVALFLGSNGSPDLREQLRMKAISLPGLLLLPVGARRLRAARSLASRRRLRRLGAPEVLYLRSFVDDGLRVRSERRSRTGLERWLPWPSERFEDVLLRGFERMGPVIAIGRPGTDQTELGAARDLVIGADWLSAVRAEMDSVAFIVVVLGPGEGLRTELLTLCERERLDRVCVVVPPVPRADVAARLSAATLPFARGLGWGDINGHAVDGHGEVVALVGVGSRRVVLVAPRRARASTYLSLAFTVSRLVADAPAEVAP